MPMKKLRHSAKGTRYTTKCVKGLLKIVQTMTTSNIGKSTIGGQSPEPSCGIGVGMALMMHNNYTHDMLPPTTGHLMLASAARPALVAYCWPVPDLLLLAAYCWPHTASDWPPWLALPQNAGV